MKPCQGDERQKKNEEMNLACVIYVFPERFAALLSVSISVVQLRSNHWEERFQLQNSEGTGPY
jgi:hypothetical protein